MKKLIAIIGLGLIAFPLVHHLTFTSRVESADSSVKVISALHGISSGMLIGFAGLMTLGFLMDGGNGYQKRPLLIIMSALGALWTAFYPSGWLLGVPLIVYSLFRLFSFRTRSEKKGINE